MILFSEIFDRAVVLFDDPDINRAYIEDPVKFQKIMLPYLTNGKGKFSSPVEISSQLTQYTSMKSAIEIFDGNGSAEYILESTPYENSVFSFKIGTTADPLAQYNKDTNKVTFSREVKEGEICSIEYCDSGAFTKEIHWSSYSARWVTDSMINERVIDILAHCTLLAWAEKEQNFILDIRNLLNDTDFKMYSPANSTNAKVNWYKSIKEGLDDLTGKLGWDMRTAQRGRF